MTAKASLKKTQAGIDPRAVPKALINWPVAFRLKPARLPATSPLAQLEPEAADILTALKDMTSPSVRHKEKRALLQGVMPAGTADTVLSAFATSVPEWRFASRGIAHMVLASSIDAAIIVASEIYRQFLQDTAQPASSLSFSVERFSLVGNFADICDQEVFPDCYDPSGAEVAQGLVTSLADAGEDGLVFQIGTDQAAVILNPTKVSERGLERALALEWDGNKFHRAYDYRDMFWRDLTP